ncbi:MAG: nitric oxide reductase activation protein NorD, partial [Oscillospiraceae bacterium]|nr:nitric oxide reductase activation protein NorD [Oscillospiraceae bacterium]
MSIHKKVRQLVADKKSNIKDKEFFTSSVLRRHFEDIAYGITQKFGKERVVVQFEWNDDPQASIAYTNGLKVVINTGSDFLKDTDRNERYQLAYGLNSHELGHI